MSTTFKKYWFRGKPLKQLQPNSKFFKYWLNGSPFDCFYQLGGPPQIVTLSETLHLTLTQYAPTINFGYCVTPSCLHLTLTQYAPACSAGTVDGANVEALDVRVIYSEPEQLNVEAVDVRVIYAVENVKVSQVIGQVEYNVACTCYPETLHLTFILHGLPTVVAISTTLSLTFTSHEPTFFASAHVAVETLHLTFAQYAPDVPSTMVLTMSTLHLSLVQHPVSVQCECKITPELRSLNLTLYTPLVLIGAKLSETLHAVLSLYSPTIKTGWTVAILFAQHLAVNQYAPTIKFGCRYIISAVQSLTLTLHEPTIKSGVFLPETLRLTLTQYAPTINFGYRVTTIVQHLTLAHHAPTIKFGSNQLVGLQSLTLSLHDPIISTGVYLQETLHLTLAQSNPTIKYDYVVALSTAQHLTLALYAPTLRASQSISVGLQSLTLTLHDPTINIGVRIYETVHLTLAQYAPTAKFGYVVAISVAFHLTLNKYSPSIKTDQHLALSTTQSLTLTLHEPYIQIGACVHETLGLTFALHKPTIDFSYIVVPSTLHLVLTQYAPTIKFGFTIPVGLQSLTLSLHNPVINTGVTLYDTLHLSLAQYSPTLKYGYTVALSTLHLTLNKYAPTIKFGYIVPIDLQSLTLTLHDPTINIGVRIYETVHLSLSQRAPSIFYSYAVVPSTVHLVSALHAPFIQTDQHLSLSQVLHATLSLSDPDVISGVRIYETLHLVGTLYAPTINFDYEVDLATVQHLKLALYSPTICFDYAVPLDLQSLTFTAPDVQVWTGVRLFETVHLSLSQSAPSIFYGYTVKPSTVHLHFALKGLTIRTTWTVRYLAPCQHLLLSAPDINVTTGATIHETSNLYLTQYSPEIITFALMVPNTQSLVATLHAPLIKISHATQVETLSLTFTSYDAVIFIGSNIRECAHLTFHQYTEIDLFYDWTQEVETLHLTFRLHDPSTIGILPFYEYDLDPLHKEREWASEYTPGEATYGSRPGSALSSNFPLRSDDTDKQLTVCFWLRLRDSGGYQLIFAKMQDDATNTPVIGLQRLHGQLTLLWAYKENDAQGWPSLDFKFSLVNERWYHIGLAVDGKNKTVYMQVWDDYLKTKQAEIWNGIYQPTINSSLVCGDGSFQIGYMHGLYGKGEMFLDGYLDEFLVFNKLKSPFEMDQIRKGTFRGQEGGQTVGDFGLTTAYDPQGKITVYDYATMAAYSPSGKITVADFGVSIGYKVPIELPPGLFPVISGFPSQNTGSGSYVFCNLKYKFKSDISSFDWQTNRESRFSEYTYPIRELETEIGVADESAFLRVWETLQSGVTIYSVPIWGLRTELTRNAHAGYTEFVVDDVSNLYVGEKVLLVRANDADLYDLCDITSIAGNTVHVELPLTRHYHKYQMITNDVWYDERSAYVVPCLTGFIDTEDLELHGTGKSTFFVKAKVNGGAWTHMGNPEMPAKVPVPAEASYISPKMERVALGTENGILSLMSSLSTGKLAFQVEWYCHNAADWKTVRDFFLAARGKYLAFYFPTYCFELRAIQSSSIGQTVIRLTKGFSALWQRFPRLYVFPIQGGDPFPIQITGCHIEGAPDFVESFTCEPLTGNLTAGDKISLYPLVRFIEDELVFEFLYYNECKIKASFIEILG